MVLPKLEPGEITSVDAYVDSKNYIHLVWGQLRWIGYPYHSTDIFYTYWNGTSWATPIEIQKESLPAGSPSIMVDDSGYVYIFWLGAMDTLFPCQTGLFYTCKDRDGWKKPKSLYDFYSGAEWLRERIRVEKDNKGNIHIVLPYSSSNLPEGMNYIIWDKDSKVLRESIPYLGYSPDFLIGEDGRTHFTYAGMPPGLPGVETALLYGTRLNGRWQDPVNIYSTLVCEGPKIVIARKRLHIVWLAGYEDIFYSSSTDGIFWSEPLNLTNEWGQNIDKSTPNALVDSKGNIHLMWQSVRRFAPITYICYMFKSKETWSGIDTVYLDWSGGGTDQKMVIDSEDKLYILWVHHWEEDADSIYFVSKSAEGIESREAIREKGCILRVFPNPFKKGIEISFHVLTSSVADLRIYNTSGRLVKTLLRTESSRDRVGNIVWRGDNENGSSLPSGVYFIRLEAGGITETEKVILAR